MKVPLLDLKPQYQALKSEINEKIKSVVESQYFILGPEVKAFEEETAAYLGVKHAIGVSSGTDALLLALMALDIKPDDEIILPTYSFFATAGVVARLNAKPVFVDIDPVTYNIDPKLIEAKITDKTKAIIPVHLYGQSADMDAILEIAKRHNLSVVEDAAQAIGVQYKDGKKVGGIGDIGCFSYFPSKNLGAFGDAGVVTTNDDELAKKMTLLRVHGTEQAYFHKMIGGNFRIDAIQAAVLRVKLPHLDKWSEARRSNAALYKKYFLDAGLITEEGSLEFDENNKVIFPKEIYKESGVTNYHIFNQFIVRVPKRDQLLEFLRSNDIGCAVYYPVPFHRQECFAYLNNNDADFPNSNMAAEQTIALPVFPELVPEQIEYVVSKIKEFIG
ncbi:MAG: DegT/DnrJ/EryC1/StrS family aminotransferase [Bacteroidetes bacterium]|nr:DegT/DnrJ/EryC1/StrS family aminotransferase [Bacteroidota bacterium]